MVREVKPESFQVYQLDELEPAARVAAIEYVQGLLSGPWWDYSAEEEITDTMVYALAEALGTPGRENYGEGDFPGIDGVVLDAWDLDRGDSVALRGTLTPQNAPALPWGAGGEEISEVRLVPAPHGGHTYIGVAIQDCEGDGPPAATRTMHEAVLEAMFKAKEAGRRQLEYQLSAERAEEDILANEREFTADGKLYRG